MMVRIPIGKKYLATVNGTAWKYVDCEFCGCEFYYLLERTGEGVTLSSMYGREKWRAPNDSVKWASKDLERRLILGYDLISCPACGKFQKKMIKRYKKLKIEDIKNSRKNFGIIGAIVSIFVFFYAQIIENPLHYSIPVLILTAWFFGFGWWIKQITNLDLNEISEERIGSGFSEDYPVLLKSEFEELFPENAKLT